MEDGQEKPYLDRWAPGLDDSSWEDVYVPHDWAVSFPFSEKWSSGTGYLPGGTGWYRTVFRVPENWKGKQAFIYFDGVYKNSQVWCNGYYLGKRPNGYIGFRYNISHCLRPGENVVAVKVSHEDFADSRWYTGSGIYRKVYICFCDRLYLDERTLTVKSICSGNQADVLVSGKVFGSFEKATMVEARIEGKDGNIFKAETMLVLAVGGYASFMVDVKVINPELWSLETPNLYKLHINIQEDGKNGAAFQAEPSVIGIRTIRFDPYHGFFLNEKPLKIKGVCLHHDSGCLGAAVWPDVWRRKLEKLKDMGCNAIRTSHNPHMVELYDLCDEMGLMVMDEAFDEWEGCKNKWTNGHNVYPPVHQGYAEDFPQWHEQDLADMVIRDRNHPSVIAWSIGNEVDYPNDPYAHPLFAEMSGNNDANKPKAEMRYSPDKPNMERLAVIASRLADIVRKYDDGRPVLFASAFPELSLQLGLFDALDIVGYNYKEHLYEADRLRFPSLPIIGSENGHSISAWKKAQNLEFISGQFLWTGIDYLGEAQGWPVRGSGAGLLDLAGNEKPAYFRRKALWIDKPFLYLVSCLLPEKPERDGEIPPWKLFRRWNYMPSQQVQVVCYTNLSRAELFCNGNSCGVAELQEYRGYISWLVPFEQGILKVESSGSTGNVCDTLGSALTPVRLHLHEWKSIASEKVKSLAGKYRIAQIEAEMLDQADNLCTDACQTVAVSLKGDGNGKILGMENGDLADCTEYASHRRRLYRGRLIIYVLLPIELSDPVFLTAIVEGFAPVVISLE